MNIVLTSKHLFHEFNLGRLWGRRDEMIPVCHRFPHAPMPSDLVTLVIRLSNSAVIAGPQPASENVVGGDARLRRLLPVGLVRRVDGGVDSTGDCAVV